MTASGKRASAVAKRGGPPSLYTKAMAEKLLAGLAEGRALRQICSGKGMPDEKTVRNWVVEDREGFGGRFHYARMFGMWLLTDEIKRVAFDDTGDIEKDDHGRITINHANVSRSKLKVDTMRFFLSKVFPEQFGDKLEVSGPGGLPIQAPVFNVMFVKSDGNGNPST